MSSAAPLQQAKSDPQPAGPDGHACISQADSEFEDRRPQAVAQRQLQEAADRSAQGRHLKAFEPMAQNSARSLQFRAVSAMLNAAPVSGAHQDKPAAPNNTGLPDKLKSGIEALSGMSMDHVQVHFNSPEPMHLNAHAFAQGSEIHVAPGQEQHLPHEAWHVVQQAQGRVRPTMQMKAGVLVNDDAGLEAEADLMGARALGQQAAPIERAGLTEHAASTRSIAPAQRMPIEDEARKHPFYRDDKVRKLSLTLRAATPTTKDFQVRGQLRHLYWKSDEADKYYNDPAHAEECDVLAFVETQRFGDWVETYKEAAVEHTRIEGQPLAPQEKTRRKDAISMYLLQHHITNALFMDKELDHLEYQASPLNYQEKSGYLRSFATSYVKSLQKAIGPLYEANKVFLVRDASYVEVLDKFFEVARCGMVEPTIDTLKEDLQSTIAKAADYVLSNNKDLADYWQGDGNPQGFVDISALLEGLGAVQQQVKTQQVGQAVRVAFTRAVAQTLVVREGGDQDVTDRLMLDVDAMVEKQQAQAALAQHPRPLAKARALLDDAVQFRKFMTWLRAYPAAMTADRQKLLDMVLPDNTLAVPRNEVEAVLSQLMAAKLYPIFLAAKVTPATLADFGDNAVKFATYEKLNPKVTRVYDSANQAVVTGGVIAMPLRRSLASAVLADAPSCAGFIAWLRTRPVSILINNVLAHFAPDNTPRLNAMAARSDLEALLGDDPAVYRAATDGTQGPVRDGFSQSAVMIDDKDMAMAVKTTSINKSGSVPTPTDSTRKLLREKPLNEIAQLVLDQQTQSRTKETSALLTKVKQQLAGFNPQTYHSLVEVGQELERTRIILAEFTEKFKNDLAPQALEARAAIKLLAGSHALDDGALPDFVLVQLRQHMQDAMANAGRLEDHVRSISGIHEAVILALELNPEPVDHTYAYAAPQFDHGAGKDKHFRGAHLTDYGLKAFSQVFDAAKAQFTANGGDTLRLEAFHNIYFELNDKLRTTVKSTRNGKVQLQSPSSVADYLNSSRFTTLNAEPGGVDVVMVDIHPNDATKKQIVSHDVKQLIDGLFGKKKDEDNFRLTMMIDITLNHPGEDEIKAIRTHAEPHISSGKLNLVFLESLAKFSQLGMDKHSGGLVFAYNNEASWSAFNQSLTAARTRDTVDPTIHKYFQALFRYAHQEQQEYLRVVRANTKLMHQLLKETFKKVNLGNHAFKIAENTDEGSCYVAIRFDDFTSRFITPQQINADETLHKITVDILELGVNTLLRKTGLPVAMRESFGFPISNLGETGTEVRFTIGIESKDKLQQYANILAYLSGSLADQYDWRLDNGSGFKAMSDKGERQALLNRLTDPVKSLETLETQLSTLI